MKAHILICLLLSLLTASSQTRSCCRAPIFDIATAPDPPIFSGIGDNTWPISTSSDSCQLYFNQGIRMNHCYNDFEAQRAFRKALKFDSSCAMCYWGILTTNYSDFNPKELKSDVAKAISFLNSNDSLYELDKAIIAATGKFLSSKNEFKRERKFYEMLLPWMDAYPDNTELKLFVADNLKGGYDKDDKPEYHQQEQLNLLHEVIKMQPQNFAAHHYLIHRLESGPDLDSALYSISILPGLAPGSPHILHMPGHIYFRNGSFEKAETAFENSFRANTAYMAKYNISPYNDWNYIHNLDFLVVNKAEMGQLQSAQPWLKLQNIIPYIKSQKHSGSNYNNYRSTYAYNVLLPMRCHEWKKMMEAADSLSKKDYPEDGFFKDYFLLTLQFGSLLKLLEADSLPEAEAEAQLFLKETEAKIKQGKKKFGKTDSYDNLCYELLGYKYYAGAFIDERKGDYTNAEKKLARLLIDEKGSYKAEPPALLLSHYEWAIEYYLRRSNYDKATTLVEEYNHYRKNSPFVAYYRFMVSKAKNTGQSEVRQAAITALEGMKMMDHDLGIYKRVEALSR